MATILLMYVAVGFKFNTIITRPKQVVISVVPIIVVVAFMISRNQLIAVALVVASLFLFLPRPVAIKAGISSALIVGVMTSILFAIGSDTQHKYLHIAITSAFEERLAQLGKGGAVTREPDSVIPMPVSVTRVSTIDTLFSENAFGRPFRSLGGAVDRWKESVIVGTGLESAPGLPAPSYHNDWATVLASAGLIGVISYALLVILFGRLELLLVVPFVLPGVTNAFLFAPQHVVLVALLGGLVAGRKLRRRQAAAGSQVPNAGSPRQGWPRRKQVVRHVGEVVAESE